jgi:hypothetical protein
MLEGDTRARGYTRTETHMHGRIPARFAVMAVAMLAASALMALAASSAGAEAVYSNVPSPLPGNFASIGFAATSSTQFGGEVELAGTPNKNSMVAVQVVMSDWACESGSWSADNCASPKHKGFREPITVSLYEVGNLTSPIATKTKNVKVPFRPSAEPVHCSGAFAGTWYDETSKECFNGLAFPFTAKMKVKGLPSKLIVTVSYPTTSVPSESLNVSISEPVEKTLSLGADPTKELFLDSSDSEMYCAGATDVGTFGGSQGECWEGDQPIFEVSAK